MELKLDVKTLVIGIAIGVIAAAAIGAVGSADKTDFGIAIPSTTTTGEGSALVRTTDDGLYIVNSKSGMAVRVLQATLRAEPTDRRDTRGKPFSLNTPSQSPTKTPAGAGY